jgi:hypothetical protein
MTRRLLLALPLSAALWATAQVADILMLDGEQRGLLTNPLETVLHQRKLQMWISPGETLTSNSRGYIATWTLDKDRLYLNKVAGWICRDAKGSDCEKAELEGLFPGKVSGGRVFAEWFTGQLRISDGEMVLRALGLPQE